MMRGEAVELKVTSGLRRVTVCVRKRVPDNVERQRREIPLRLWNEKRRDSLWQ
jgi:hypothetical protein